MASQARDAHERKRHGRHYTPPELARFLARRALAHAPRGGELRVLDPACGDGELLLAVRREAPPDVTVRLTGYDLDRHAVVETPPRPGGPPGGEALAPRVFKGGHAPPERRAAWVCGLPDARARDHYGRPFLVLATRAVDEAADQEY
uniref:N-6 DNA methylase n=1 Tax=Nocardia neocaledoniensis TaxID=236511 RepID=UPI002458B3BC